MEIKYQFVLLICLIVVLLFTVLYITSGKKKEDFLGGKKVVGTYYAKDTPYLKKRIRIYKITKCLLVIVSIFCVCTSSLMLARPYKEEVTEKTMNNRDIMLCIDVSYSVIELDFKLISELKDVVKQLKGDRFGIVIFNSSPVLVSPLTDDYDYICERLDDIEKGLYLNLDENMLNDIESSGEISKKYADLDSDDWLLYNTYIQSGTLVGAEERGSSLISDGLASCALDFQETEEPRTKLIILASDNEFNGDPYVTLDEATQICIDNKVKVFGVGTWNMDDRDMASMKASVERTGGKFYLEEERGTVDNIVKSIENESKSDLKTEKEVKENPIIFAPFLMLIFGVTGLLLLKKISKEK